MRSQRQIALAHSGVKLTGPAEGYGRKKELQVRQWLTNLPSSAVDATSPPYDDQTAASDFEDLPPVVKDLYRQLTDSTDGLLPPVIDNAPTYPNSNIPRRPASPKVLSTKPVVRTQSKVPQAPDAARTPSQQTLVANSSQSPITSKLSKQIDDPKPVERVITQPDIRAVSTSSIPVSPVISGEATAAAEPSFAASVSTVDAGTDHESNSRTTSVEQGLESDQLVFESAIKTLDCPESLLATVRQSAAALLQHARKEPASAVQVLYQGLLQAVINHEKYKQQVRLELQDARKKVAEADTQAAQGIQSLKRQLEAESSRADRAEQSVQGLQATALQAKQKAQALKLELDEHQEKSENLTTQIEQATEQLHHSSAAHAATIQHLEKQLQAAKQEAQKANEGVVSMQKQQQLLQKRLEAQITSLESQLQARSNSLATLNQDNSNLKNQLAIEAKARAAAEESEQAALRGLREQAEVTAEIQKVVASSWVLQQRHDVNAARMAVLSPGTSFASKQADASKREAVGDRLARLESIEEFPVTRSPRVSMTAKLNARDSNIPASSSGLAASASSAGKIPLRKKEGNAVAGGVTESPSKTEDDLRRKGTAARSGNVQSSTTRELARSDSRGAAVNKDNTASPKSRSLARSATAERRLLAEAQKAERRAAANAVLEESRLQEVALEAAPSHMRCLGLAFRACILSPDQTHSLMAKELEALLSPGYRVFVDPAAPPASQAEDKSQPYITPQSNPLISLCQAVIWLAACTIPAHICEQLSYTCTQGRSLIILAPQQISHQPQFDTQWLAANCSSAVAAAESEALSGFVTQAWQKRIVIPGSGDIQAAVEQTALHLGVCDAALQLVSAAVLRRAKKCLQPDLLHLNLPGLNQLNLEGNSMPELVRAVQVNAKENAHVSPHLSLGKSATADLCYALHNNSSIKLLTLANLPINIIQAFARAVTAEGCGVVTIHTHNHIPVGQLLGRTPPCPELKLSRPLTAEDAAVLSVILPLSTAPATSISLTSDPGLPPSSTAALCSVLSQSTTLQLFNDLNLPRLEAIASGCSPAAPSMVDLGGCVVGPLGAQLIAHRLQRHSSSLAHVCGLNATSCQLAPAGLAHLLDLLQPACGSNRMQALCLADNKCGPAGLPSIAKAFQSAAPTLAVLDLSMNCLANEGAVALTPLLLNMPGLRCLGLGHNAIGSEGLRALCSSLTRLSQLQELQLGGNVLGDDGVVALAAGLSTLTNLEVLSLQENYNLGVECGRCLGAALPSCASLRQLNLAKSHLGPEGAKHLAAGIQEAPALTTLNLELCKIRAAGASALAGPVSCAPCLQELILARNSIGDAGATALAQALTKNCSLTHLDLRNNGIGQVGGAALKTLLARPSCSLHSVALAGNREEAHLEEVLMTSNMARNKQGTANSRKSEALSIPGSRGAPTTSSAQVAASLPLTSTEPSSARGGINAVDLANDRPGSYSSSSTSALTPNLIAAKQQLPPSSLATHWRSSPISDKPTADISHPKPQTSKREDVAAAAAYAPRAGEWTEDSHLGLLAGVAGAGRLGDAYEAMKQLERTCSKQTDLVLPQQANSDCETSSDSLEAALERYRKR